MKKLNIKKFAQETGISQKKFKSIFLLPFKNTSEAKSVFHLTTDKIEKSHAKKEWDRLAEIRLASAKSLKTSISALQSIRPKNKNLVNKALEKILIEIVNIAEIKSLLRRLFIYEKGHDQHQQGIYLKKKNHKRFKKVLEKLLDQKEKELIDTADTFEKILLLFNEIDSESLNYKALVKKFKKIKRDTIKETEDKKDLLNLIKNTKGIYSEELQRQIINKLKKFYLTEE